jgi:VanZ family protein
MTRFPRWIPAACWLAFFAWAAAIHVLSSLSGADVAKLPFDIWDKFAHFAAFAVGAALLALALRLSVMWPWKGIAPLAIAVISAYGAFDEWHQQFTPGRRGLDPGDWTADTLGAAAGTLATTFLYARYSRTPRLAPAGA